MSVLTLLVTPAGAKLLDGAGLLLADLPGEPSAQALRAALPAGAAVQLVLDLPQLTLNCQDVPFLAQRERQEVQTRLAPPREGQQNALALEVDPAAQGGHVLWMASVPQRNLNPWLDALMEAGARPVFAMPWQRAFLAALRQGEPSALYLILEPEAGRLLYFQGRSLRFMRTFPLDGAPLAEELTRLLQFIQQKHRGAALGSLTALGLPEAEAPALQGVARTLGLAFESLAQEPQAFLVAGAHRERARKGGLDLLPIAIRAARSRRVFRAVVWAAATGMLLLAAGTKAFLIHHERALVQEARRAEDARDQRQSLARQGEEAVFLRFGLLRLRWAEARQRQATEQMEQLGLRLFQAPPGVTLEKVEIHQIPGDPVEHRFTLEGSAVTRKGFSMGSLSAYFDHLAALPHLRLEPIKEVSVVDRGAEAVPSRRAEQALTHFKLEGTLP